MARTTEATDKRYFDQLEINFDDIEDEIITVNYAEIRKIRKFVRALIGVMAGTEKHAYESANAYIGKGTTNVVFYEINVNVHQMGSIERLTRNAFPEYEVYKIFKKLRVYLRGTRRVNHG